jgi:hypothetical protein
MAAHPAKNVASTNTTRPFIMVDFLRIFYLPTARPGLGGAHHYLLLTDGHEDEFPSETKPLPR